MLQSARTLRITLLVVCGGPQAYESCLLQGTEYERTVEVAKQHRSEGSVLRPATWHSHLYGELFIQLSDQSRLWILVRIHLYRQ